MAKKSAIANQFNADEATVDTIVENNEIVKKGKYKVFNGSEYETIYLQTSADQVIESDAKKFVSQAEKDSWNNKSDSNHNHDDVYAKLENTYNKTEIDSQISDLEDLINHGGDATTQLTQRVDTLENTTIPAIQTSISDLETSKADKQHRHNVSDIDGLGTAAVKNVGTSAGNVPILNDNGKLEASILPSIAVNETFTASTISEAMALPLEIGDILVLESSVADNVPASISYSDNENKRTLSLSDEYTTYIASGKMTYLCVSITADTFEDKFKPLQSSSDTISSGEVNQALSLKVDKTDFNTYKEEVTDNLNTKVDKVDGKQLSTNDFTNTLKDKLDNIEEGANNYTHPTGDGNLHVPATGTTNNGNVLIAGNTEGSISWKALTTDDVQDKADKRYVTDEQIEQWNNKSDSDHLHEQYRLISDSFNKTETIAEINKLKTIVSATEPVTGTHIAGAVWIEEL